MFFFDGFNYKYIAVVVFLPLFLINWLVVYTGADQTYEIVLLPLLLLLLLSYLFRTNSYDVEEYVALSACLFCIVEFIGAFFQMLDLLPLRNPIFKASGSFFNPGLMGGAFACCLPLILRLLDRNKSIFVVVSTGFCIGGMVLSQSRSAIVAALIACSIYYRITRARSLVKWLCLLFAFSLVFLLLVSFIVSGKLGSVEGRMLIWKLSFLSFMEKPWGGWTSFAQAYNWSAENYFTFGECRSVNEWVRAGAPRYPFSEFLFLAIFGGVPLLLIVMLLIAVVLYRLYNSGNFSLMCSFLAILIFSFFSYPYHVVWFWGLTGLFVSVAFPIRNRMLKYLLLGVLVYVQVHCVVKCCYVSEWYKSRLDYNLSYYSVVVNKYSVLYHALNDNERFLFQYAYALYRVGKYNESLSYFRKVQELTTDPLVPMYMGACFEHLKNYQDAEICYKRAATRIPGLIRPYCLLWQMYKNYGDSVKQERMKALILEYPCIKESYVADTIRSLVLKDKMLPLL